MHILSKFSYVMLFVSLAACQFNLKVTDENNKLKVDKLGVSNFYMHNATGVGADKLDVYLDEKRINLEQLDLSGVNLKPGRHSLDVKNKSSREPADHFDFEVQNQEKHMYLCIDPSRPNHYRLSSEKNINCLDSN